MRQSRFQFRCQHGAASLSSSNKSVERKYTYNPKSIWQNECSPCCNYEEVTTFKPRRGRDKVIPFKRKLYLAFRILRNVKHKMLSEEGLIPLLDFSCNKSYNISTNCRYGSAGGLSPFDDTPHSVWLTAWSIKIYKYVAFQDWEDYIYIDPYVSSTILYDLLRTLIKLCTLEANSSAYNYVSR